MTMKSTTRGQVLMTANALRNMAKAVPFLRSVLLDHAADLEGAVKDPADRASQGGTDGPAAAGRNEFEAGLLATGDVIGWGR